MSKKNAIPDRRSALPGEKFTYAERFLQIYPWARGEITVADKGDGNSGQWVCISCGTPLENQIDKDNHCRGKAPKKTCLKNALGVPARHVLAWRSFVSGEIEMP